MARWDISLGFDRHPEEEEIDLHESQVPQEKSFWLWVVQVLETHPVLENLGKRR